MTSGGDGTLFEAQTEQNQNASLLVDQAHVRAERPASTKGAPCVLAIDPGLSGGLAFLPRQGDDQPIMFVMPVIEVKGKKKGDKIKHEYDLGAIRNLIIERNVVHVFIEKQQPMTKPQIKRCPRCACVVETTQAQGIISTFNTGRGFGLLEGLVAGLMIPYTVIAPQSWQPKLLGGVQGADSKAKARVVIGRLFPGLDLRASERARTPHEGKVDALLIGVFGLRQFGVDVTPAIDSELGF
jgi:crossover junction endodeoxyribonuclease RuvC